jgi:hypothetical protein
MPQVLKERMRHESIETTLHCDVGQTARATADVPWAAREEAAGNASGNRGPNHGQRPSNKPAATVSHNELFRVPPEGLEPSAL